MCTSDPHTAVLTVITPYEHKYIWEVLREARATFHGAIRISICEYTDISNVQIQRGDTTREEVIPQECPVVPKLSAVAVPASDSDDEWVRAYNKMKSRPPTLRVSRSSSESSHSPRSGEDKAAEESLDSVDEDELALIKSLRSLDVLRTPRRKRGKIVVPTLKTLAIEPFTYANKYGYVVKFGSVELGRVEQWGNRYQNITAICKGKNHGGKCRVPFSKANLPPAEVLHAWFLEPESIDCATHIERGRQLRLPK